MGLSRRIKHRYKFTRKHLTDIYGLLTRKKSTKDIFKNRFLSFLLNNEISVMAKKIAKTLQDVKVGHDYEKKIKFFWLVRFKNNFLFLGKYLIQFINNLQIFIKRKIKEQLNWIEVKKFKGLNIKLNYMVLKYKKILELKKRICRILISFFREEILESITIEEEKRDSVRIDEIALEYLNLLTKNIIEKSNSNIKKQKRFNKYFNNKIIKAITETNFKEEWTELYNLNYFQYQNLNYDVKKKLFSKECSELLNNYGSKFTFRKNTITLKKNKLRNIKHIKLRLKNYFVRYHLIYAKNNNIQQWILDNKKESLQNLGFVMTAKEDSWFFSDVIKMLTIYPFLKYKFVDSFPLVWNSILNYTSQKMKSFLLLDFYFNRNTIDFFSNKQKVLKEGNVFCFLNRGKELNLNIQAPRVFEFFLSRLKAKYGFFVPSVPFRLDIPLPRYKYKKETERLKMYKLLKISQRFLGNIQKKVMWKIRKISLTKNKGSAFFNSLLLVESRLDIFINRCQIAKTMYDAKNFIERGWITVNGKQIYNYNYSVSIGDIVSIHTEYKIDYKLYLLNKMLKSLEELSSPLNKIFPSYLEMDFLNINVGYIAYLFDIVKIPTRFAETKGLTVNWGRFMY